MKRIIGLTSLVVVAIFLSGCSNLPDGKIGYYLAKSEVSFKVVRTVACDANNNLIVVNSITPIVTHSADHEQFGTIDLSELKGLFSDTDIKFEFYEDGRLKGINSSTTGQGETILKTFTVVTTAAVSALKISALKVEKKYEKECKFIKVNGGGKPLTLTYEGKIDISKDAEKKQNIPPDPSCSFYAIQLRSAIGDVYAVMEEADVPKQVPLIYLSQNGDVLVKARQPGLLKIKVMVGGINAHQGDTIWKGELPVAQLGKDYSIPILPPAIFGKQILNVSFQESGALNTLQYTSDTGSGQALNVANSVLNALQSETATQKAENVKAKADLIVQQQRLAKCLADPKSCE